MTIKTIDTNKCTGCKVCVDACPMDVIRFNENAKKAEIKYARDCVCCYNCEQDCPVQAIYVDPLRATISLVPPAW